MEDDDDAAGHRRRGRRGHRHGGPGDMNFMFRFGPPGGRGPRARRGDVRAAALLLLAEEPRNGYAIMQAIQERTGGVWRPSPGAVYPALQQLEDEGLIRAEEGAGGRRAYQLTDDGRHYAETHPEELDAPWDAVANPAGGAVEMRSLIGQLAMAAHQVLSAGTDAQVTEARKILTDSRRALYRILAADDQEASAPAEGQ
jgi:DNA-binding PadR family transcriptional regulator